MKKKSLRKRMMAVGIVLSMTAALLAGCGGSGEKEAKTSESEKKELVMWTFMSKENSYGIINIRFLGFFNSFKIKLIFLFLFHSFTLSSHHLKHQNIHLLYDIHILFLKTYTCPF